MTEASARRRSPRGGGEQLRADIIAAVKDLLIETDGVEAVSIRAVAQRVGVTAPSIYLHFADKDALIDAVVSDVFAELDAAIASAAAGVSTPLARLLAEGVAYVRWAVEHPEHYRVAVMQTDHTPPDVDDVIREGAFARLMETVQECIAAGIFPPGDPLPLALELWTSAHGVAALVIAKPYIPWGDVETLARRALTAAGLGHAVEGLFGGDEDFEAIASWVRKRRASRQN
ncbi:MAG TPA: TetR/AcrR family transcriptional regulator [Jatrophihabitans sp.]|jgi:AcrR family transcriptional regulator